VVRAPPPPEVGPKEEEEQSLVSVTHFSWAGFKSFKHLEFLKSSKSSSPSDGSPLRALAEIFSKPSSTIIVAADSFFVSARPYSHSPGTSLVVMRSRATSFSSSFSTRAFPKIMTDS
jgi:hypothetical protein